jgi:hypothetical protein
LNTKRTFLAFLAAARTTRALHHSGLNLDGTSR